MNTAMKPQLSAPALRTINPKLFGDRAAELFGRKKTVAHFYIRRMKEAGVIPSGDMGQKGRPPKAAGITVDQAVILLLGFLGSQTAKNAARATREAASLPYAGMQNEPATLADDLAICLSKWIETSDPRFLPDVFVTGKADKPCLARLRFRGFPVKGKEAAEEKVYGVSPDEAFSLTCGVAPSATMKQLFSLFCEGTK